MTNEKKIEWLLRIGVAGEFLGHGLLAIGYNFSLVEPMLIPKADWVKWMVQLTHVSSGVATNLMIVIGCLDVIVAMIVLFRPIRPVLLWATFWGFWTALVRPLVGVCWLDFIERFANWAAPLALYFNLDKSK